MQLLSDWQIRNLAIPIADKIDEIAKFYENPDNERRFQEWLKNKRMQEAGQEVIPCTDTSASGAAHI